MTISTQKVLEDRKYRGQYQPRSMEKKDQTDGEKTMVHRHPPNPERLI